MRLSATSSLRLFNSATKVVLAHLLVSLLGSAVHGTAIRHSAADSFVSPGEGLLYACLALPFRLLLPVCKLISVCLALSVFAYMVALALEQQGYMHTHPAMHQRVDHALRFLLAPTVGLTADISKLRLQQLAPANLPVKCSARPAIAAAAAAPLPVVLQPAAPSRTLPQQLQQAECRGMAAARPGSAQRADSLPHGSASGLASGIAETASPVYDLDLNSMSEPECSSPPPAYLSRRRRARVTVKVPHVDSPQELPSLSAHAVQSRLCAQGSDLHVHTLSVRPGCIIVDLDLVQPLAAVSRSDSGSSGTLDLSAEELVQLLQLEQAVGAAEGNVVSVSINGQVSLLQRDVDTKGWTMVPQQPTSASVRSPAGTTWAGHSVPPMCMTLDQTLVRVSLAVGGSGAKGCTFEAVSGGVPLPCKVVSDSRSAAAATSRGAGSASQLEDEHEGVVVLEVDLSHAMPGLARCNVWSSPVPVSCLLASQALLLLPAGFSAAAAELSKVPDASDPTTADDLFSDIGELLQLRGSPDLGSCPSASTLGYLAQHGPLTREYLEALAETGQGVLAWCEDACCPATAQMVRAQAEHADAVFARAVAKEHMCEAWVEDPEQVDQKLDAKPSKAALTPVVGLAVRRAMVAGSSTPASQPATPAVRGAGLTRSVLVPTTPSRAQEAPVSAFGERSIMRSFAAAARRVDAALPLGKRELQASALPPALWAIIVCCKCMAASMRSMIDGTGLPELAALALWGLPYVLILIARSLQRGSGSEGGSNGPPSPRPTTTAGKLGAFLVRHTRVYLHLHRSLIVALMGLGYLRIPFVFTITSAGVDVPAKALYMAMEAYDYKSAILVILAADIPAFYFLYTRLQVSNALTHVVALGVLGVGMQLAMKWWRTVLDVPRLKQA